MHGPERKLRPLLAGKGITEAVETFMAHQDVPGVIVLSAAHKAKSQRRRRVPWSLAEEANLRAGVVKYSVGNWHKILRDSEFKFAPCRTPVDLKDKWRNMEEYVEYAAHKIRAFTVLDQNHQPFYTTAGKIHVFRNRWPCDAARKAATRTQFYPNENARATILYIKELLSSKDEDSAVHVFKATRQLVRDVPDIERFATHRQLWTAGVEKIREEKFIPADDLRRLIQEESRRALAAH
jgi:hypothetical protein